MKIIVSILIFLSSISSAAQSGGQQNRYDDGSYYNDDYIHDESLQNINVPPPSDEMGPEISEPIARPKPPKKPAPKKRRPAGGFIEVHSGGRMGDFIEVGGGDSNSNDSRGSK